MAIYKVTVYTKIAKLNTSMKEPIKFSFFDLIPSHDMSISSARASSPPVLNTGSSFGSSFGSSPGRFGSNPSCGGCSPSGYTSYK